MPLPNDGEVICLSDKFQTPLTRNDVTCWRCGSDKLLVVRPWSVDVEVEGSRVRTRCKSINPGNGSSCGQSKGHPGNHMCVCGCDMRWKDITTVK